jgi:HlyD family secretion protein
LALLTYEWWPKPTPIKTTHASYRDLQQTATAVGTIIPRHVVSVKSQIAGTVAKLHQQAGDAVQKGQLLLEIKPNPTPKELAQAIELVERDRAALKSSQTQLKSFERLKASGVVGNNYGELVRAREKYQQDLATLAFDEQNLNLLKKGEAHIDNHLVKSAVASPISGRILQRNVDIGDTVFSSSSMQPATTLFTIADMHNMIFRGTVDQTDSQRLKVGMPATLTIGALAQEKISGKITTLSLQSEEQNQKYVPNNASWSSGDNNGPFNVGFAIEISQLKLPKGIQLKSGYSATATMILATHLHVLSIDESLVHFNHKQATVTLLDAEQKPHAQAITLGLSDGVHVEVLSGLKSSDRIVLPTKTHT